MFRQSWYTKLFIKHVLRVQRTPFYLRVGYADSPRLKPLGDKVMTTWRALIYLALSIAILTFLAMVRLTLRHDGAGVNHLLVFDCLAVGLAWVAHRIRFQIMIDRRWS